MEKVALAIQELNGKLFHRRKLFVNINKSLPKRTPSVAKWPQELSVGVLVSPCPGHLVFTPQSLTGFFSVLSSSSHPVSLWRKEGLDEFRELSWLLTVRSKIGCRKLGIFKDKKGNEAVHSCLFNLEY